MSFVSFQLQGFYPTLVITTMSDFSKGGGGRLFKLKLKCLTIKMSRNLVNKIKPSINSVDKVG